MSSKKQAEAEKRLCDSCDDNEGYDKYDGMCSSCYTFNKGKKNPFRHYIFTLLVLVLVGGAQAYLSTNLVTYYKCDDASTFPDELGLKNGTVTTSTSSAGKLGNAWNGTGTGYTSVSGGTTSGVKTINFWVYPKNNNVYQFKQSSGWELYISSGNGIVMCPNNCSSSIQSAAGTITANRWTMVTYVAGNGTAGTAKLYLNGSAVSPSTNDDYATSLLAGSGTLYIEAYSSSSGKFNGMVDEIGFWSRQLSSTEISALYNNSNACRYSNLATSDTTCTNTLPSTPFYTINATNNKTGASITTFNATIEGTTYATTNGTIFINSSVLSNNITNITLRSTNYIDRYLTDANISANVSTDIMPYTYITVRDITDNATVGGAEVYYNAVKYTTDSLAGDVYVPVNETTFSYTVKATNYIDKDFTGASQGVSINATIYQVEAHYVGYETVAGTQLNNIRVTINGSTSNYATSPTAYLRAGTYNILFHQLDIIFDTTVSATYTPKQNVTTYANITPLYVNITAKNTDDIAVSNFTVRANSSEYSWQQNYTTTNGSVIIPLTATTVTFTINSSGYLEQNWTQSLSVSQLYNVSRTLGYQTIDGVSNLTSPSQTKTSVYATWVNPVTPDFSFDKVYFNGVNVFNISAQSYNFTGLTPSQSVNITIYTYDVNNRSNGVAAELINGTLPNAAPTFNYTPTNLTPVLQENSSTNFTVTVGDDDNANVTVSWWKNAINVLTESIARGATSIWQFITGYQDSGAYNVTVNVTDQYNSSVTQTWNVTVTDTYPTPKEPASLYVVDSNQEYSIPLYCVIDYNPLKPYHFEFEYNINGTGYQSLNINTTSGFYLFDIRRDSYGTTYTFGCKVASASGESNYTYSTTVTKVNKNNFYVFMVSPSETFQSMIPYNLGYLMEVDNSIGATLYAGFVDCNGDGSWDYTYDYSHDNRTRARETFACINAKGNHETTAGMVIYKNNTASWDTLGCSGLAYDENYCIVYKSYTLVVT